MGFNQLTPRERITACHISFMRDPEFTLLGGVTQIGKVEITQEKTASTDGCNCFYGEQYIMGLSCEELRYEVAHENVHKALHHCVEYTQFVEKYGQVTNAAMDVVVDWTIETLDGGRGFAKRPAWLPPISTHAKYKDWSWLEVLKDMLENGKKQQAGGGGGQGAGGSTGSGGSRDVHIQSKPGSGDTEEGKALKQQIQDAVNLGRLVAEKLRGQGKGGAKLSGFQERKTDWRTPLRKFISEICEGDEHSRFNPPNRRFLPHNIVMPSHFSESTGELVIACDTSGSMAGVLPLVFGEVARVCQQVQPEAVRVIWWSDGIEGVQRFTPKDYAGIAKLMAPKGGGGTTVSCVARYLKENKVKAKACIMLTDGYIESNYDVPEGPLLWGIVDNERFVPRKGKALHLQSLGMQ